MKKIKWVAGVCSGLAAAVLTFTLTVSSAIPDEFSVVEGQGFAINSGLPISTVSVDGLDRKAGDSYQAVSYTHLDVYKRQVPSSNGWR